METVIDIPSSSQTLDYQLEYFLKSEKLYVDINNIKLRCLGCNSINFTYIPILYLRYLHFKVVMTNPKFHEFVNEEQLEKCTASIKDYVYPLINYGITTLNEDGNYMIYTKNAMIDPEKLIIKNRQMFSRRKPRRVPVNGEKIVPTSLKMTTNVSADQLDTSPYTLIAICIDCGKENNHIKKEPFKHLTCLN